jgi:hypothetical protein
MPAVLERDRCCRQDGPPVYDRGKDHPIAQVGAVDSTDIAR